MREEFRGTKLVWETLCEIKINHFPEIYKFYLVIYHLIWSWSPVCFITFTNHVTWVMPLNKDSKNFHLII